MTEASDKTDAPVECDVCQGYHRPSYSGDCRGWDHNFTHVDMLSEDERVRLPEGAVVHDANGEPMISDHDAQTAVPGAR